MSEHKKDDDSLDEVQIAEDDCINAEQPQPRRQTKTVRTRLRPFEVQTTADGEPFDILPMKKTC
jgi:hypothetical protein